MRSIRPGLRQAFGHGVGGLQPGNVGARQHHGGEVAVVQVEDVAHHLVFVFFDDAGVHALFQAGGDFGLGHGAGVGGVDAQQLEHAVGAHGQQAHKRLGTGGHPGHGHGHHTGHGFGVELANALGHQFAKQNGDEGDDGDHNGRGRDFSGAVRQGDGGLQPSRQAVAKGGLAHDAVEHANGGDAHLYGR